MNFLFLAVFDVAWMVLYDFTAEHLAVYMGIDFRRGNALVAQHALDGSQVGTSFQQVGGKGVAEGVWTDVFGDAGFVGQFFNEVEYHDA